MPFYLKISREAYGQLAIWKIDEPISYFEGRCNIFPEERGQFKNLKGNKRLEWFASRYLLQLINEQDEKIVCIKDIHGKPYLRNSSRHISLSHSHKMAAVISSKYSVGIDIQKIVSKIERISKKFINEQEFDYLGYNNRIEKMHIIWGAKESLYKAYGKRSLDFRKHMFISEFDYDPEGCILKGVVNKDGLKLEFNLWAGKLENYILVYGVQI